MRSRREIANARLVHCQRPISEEARKGFRDRDRRLRFRRLRAALPFALERPRAHVLVALGAYPDALFGAIAEELDIGPQHTGDHDRGRVRRRASI